MWRKSYKANRKFVGIRKMTVYNGTVFGGFSNGPDGPDPSARQYDTASIYTNPLNEGPKVFQYMNDGSWRMLDDEGMIGGTQRTIRTLCPSYSGLLYVGTEGWDVSKLFSYNAANEEWKLIEERDTVIAYAECYEYEPGKMLIGTWDIGSWDLRLIDENGGGGPISIKPDIDFEGNIGIMELRQFKDWFYVGILNFDRGFAMLRSQNIFDSSSWGSCYKQWFW